MKIVLDKNYFVWHNSLMDRLKGDILRGHIETIVLSVLARGKTHGFELMQRMNAEGNGAFHMKEGTIYPVLYRLEKAGYVKARWAGANEKSYGPRRRIYEITKQGSRELANRRREWRSFVAAVGRIVEA